MFNPIKLANKNFLSSLDLTTEEVIHILEVAGQFKKKELRYLYHLKLIDILEFSSKLTRNWV